MQTKLKSSVLLSIAIASTFSSNAVLAHKEGDIVLRAGLAQVEPREESTDVSIDSPNLGTVAGAKVGVDNNIQLGLTGTYMVTDNFGIGLLAATPFSHDIIAADAIAGVGKLGETKHLPPTLTAQYFFNNPSDKFQPYVGVGLNYTVFFDEDTTDTLTGAIGTLASLAATPTAGVTATSTDLDLDNSFGLALEIGMDYELTEKLGVNISYWMLDIDTDATITAETNVGTVTATTEVEIDPNVFFIGLNYSF